MEIVTRSLQDLINYFQPPLEGLDHEAKQNNMTALKNRQNMFQEEVNLYVYMDNSVLHVVCLSLFHKYTIFSSQGVIDLVLDCIDRLHQYISVSHFAEGAQSDTEEWETILNRFYELLGENWQTSSDNRWLNITFSFSILTRQHWLSTDTDTKQIHIFPLW